MNTNTDPDLRLRFLPFPPSAKQIVFLSMPDREVLFGGSQGPGKSAALLMAALMYCDVPGYAALIVRRDLATMTAPGGVIPMAREWLTETCPAAVENKMDHEWEFPSGAKLKFGYMRSSSGVTAARRFGSTEFQYIGVDESTEIPMDEVLTVAGRLRRGPSKGAADDGTTLADVPMRLRLAANPGNLSHEEHRARYVDEGRQAPFLPALFKDNPGLDIEDYEKSLALLPPAEYARLALGSWEDVDEVGALVQSSEIGYGIAPDVGWQTIGVGIDPTVSAGTGDECGIVVVGLHETGIVWVLADYSLRTDPDTWTAQAARAAAEHKATWLLYEDNKGGKQTGSLLTRALGDIGYRANVISDHAKPGESKEYRAAPISVAIKRQVVLFDVHLKGGHLARQWSSWIPKARGGGSPDRIDAMVWAAARALTGNRGIGAIDPDLLQL